jgi:hypothetical protein
MRPLGSLRVAVGVALALQVRSCTCVLDRDRRVTKIQYIWIVRSEVNE